MEMKWKDAFFLVFLAIFIVIVGAALITFKSKGTICVNNPLEYGVKVYEEATGDDVLCTCSFSNPDYLTMIVTDNSTEPLFNQESNLSSKFYSNFTLK